MNMHDIFFNELEKIAQFERISPTFRSGVKRTIPHPGHRKLVYQRAKYLSRLGTKGWLGSMSQSGIPVEQLETLVKQYRGAFPSGLKAVGKATKATKMPGIWRLIRKLKLKM